MTFILNVSSGKITLCYGKLTVHEIWVEWPWDKRMIFSVLLITWVSAKFVTGSRSHLSSSSSS